MIVSFPCWRKGEVKILGSVITEALTRGHDVRLVWRPETKPGEAVDAISLAQRWPQATVVEQPAGVYLIPLQAVHPRPVPAGVTVVVSIDHALNHLAVIDPLGVNVITTTSEWEVDRMGPWPTVITGDPLLDGLTECDPQATRERYGLGARPVVILFSLKLKVGHFWRRWVYAGLGYRQTVQAARRLCDRTGALLVVKTRKKHGDPAWLHRLADRVVYDEDLYPCTSLQLLNVAAFAIHWQSGAVYECVAAGVPSLSIHVPQPHLAGYPSTPLLFPPTAHNRTPQHWPNAVAHRHWSIARYTLDDIDTLPTMHPGIRRDYLQTIYGFDDLRSAARVVDVVEAL